MTIKETMITCILCDSTELEELTFGTGLGYVHICKACGTVHEHLPIRDESGEYLQGISGNLVFYDYTKPGKRLKK